MMRARFHKYVLDFKRPSGTSRGVMTQKETWLLVLEQNGQYGIGECGMLRGLSADDRPDYQSRLQWVCDHIDTGLERLWPELMEFPSIQFGLEMAFASLQAQDPMVLFPSHFTQGSAAIPINGLVWMGDASYMRAQISQKLQDGFSCIKLKIGAIDFGQELSLLEAIRKEFSAQQIEIRVDANGAFSSKEALGKLRQLAQFELHSIEQPIAKGHWQAMAELCAQSPLPIALDEELIGVFHQDQQIQMLETIRPQYLIFKPSFIGGFRGTSNWIALAEQFGAGCWITSALESNIGLNAIAQYTFGLNPTIPQGLGTGALYTNNFESPLQVRAGQLHYNPEMAWEIPARFRAI